MANETKITAQNVERLEEGKHIGVIEDVFRDTENYDYMRFKIGIEGKNMQLVLGFPSTVSLNPDGTGASGLARFGLRMGMDLSPEKEYDFADLKNKKVSFLVADKETKNGIFSEIQKETVKPSE